MSRGERAIYADRSRAGASGTRTYGDEKCRCARAIGERPTWKARILIARGDLRRWKMASPVRSWRLSEVQHGVWGGVGRLASARDAQHTSEKAVDRGVSRREVEGIWS
jgi:hypothetical protein